MGGILTGRGADIIIVDDPLKADDALSDIRRNAVNTWYDNTLRSRLNSLDTGAIIIVMQRLHADDLVAHVQERETGMSVLLQPLQSKTKNTNSQHLTEERRITRRTGEALHPARMSLAQLEAQRQAMTEYNFAAQYQQDPQAPSGLIVKREWLKIL